MSGVTGGRRSDGGGVHDIRKASIVLVGARHTFLRDFRVQLNPS